jgi:hypothetical protein
MDQRYEFRNNDHDESVVHPRFGFGRVGILRRFSAYSDYGSRVEVTRLVPYIYIRGSIASQHISLYKKPAHSSCPRAQFIRLLREVLEAGQMISFVVSRLPHSAFRYSSSS